MVKDLSEDDYVVDPSTPVMHKDKVIESAGHMVDAYMWNTFDTGEPVSIMSKVPQVDADVMLNACEDYEELMFLHEQLAGINRVLFDIMQNHRPEHKQTFQQWLNV
jgi:hypothetical protein